MNHLSFLFASIFSLVCATSVFGQDYQKIADATAWSWSAERASVSDSFLKFPNTYQVELIRPKEKIGIVTIRFLDDGKEVFAWAGHFGSEFALSGDVLVDRKSVV